MDKKLNFGKHISMHEVKLSKSIDVLNKLQHMLPKNALRTLYYSMVHPLQLYGLVF